MAVPRAASKVTKLDEVVAKLTSPGPGKMSLSSGSVTKVTFVLRPSLPHSSRPLAKGALPRLAYANPSIPIEVRYLPARKKLADGTYELKGEQPAAESTPAATNAEQAIEIDYKGMPSRRIPIGKKNVTEILKELHDLTR